MNDSSDRTCDGPREYKTPPGDDRPRLMCPDCQYVEYENPRIVVASVARFQERILLCRRAIGPRVGYWCLPGGYLEFNETVEAGACREAVEEANAQPALTGMLAAYTLPHIREVQLIFRARIRNETLAPGVESLEVGLFAWNEIPWDDLAFRSHRWALLHDSQAARAGVWETAGNPEAVVPMACC